MFGSSATSFVPEGRYSMFAPTPAPISSTVPGRMSENAASLRERSPG